MGVPPPWDVGKAFGKAPLQKGWEHWVVENIFSRRETNFSISRRLRFPSSPPLPAVLGPSPFFKVSFSISYPPGPLPAVLSSSNGGALFHFCLAAGRRKATFALPRGPIQLDLRTFRYTAGFTFLFYVSLSLKPGNPRETALFSFLRRHQLRSRRLLTSPPRPQNHRSSPRESSWSLSGSFATRQPSNNGNRSRPSPTRRQDRMAVTA